MKKINIIYWISTALICFLMGASGLAGIIMGPNNPQTVHNPFGYPVYFMMFISAAKVLGAIAILTPGFNKLKEWAYAGFTFDLIGATYSMLAVHMAVSNIAGMPIFFAVLAVSYIYHHKRLEAKKSAQV